MYSLIAALQITICMFLRSSGESAYGTTHFLHPNLNETDVEKEKVVFVEGRICKATDLAFCSHFYCVIAVRKRCIS